MTCEPRHALNEQDGALCVEQVPLQQIADQFGTLIMSTLRNTEDSISATGCCVVTPEGADSLLGKGQFESRYSFSV